MGRQITKLTAAHDAMIDMILANPRITNEELAAQFDMGHTWVATLRHTDLFKRRMEDRREAVIDPVLIASIEEKIRAVTDMAVEHILEKLATKKADELTDQFLLRAAEFGAKSMGLGSGEKPEPDAPPDHLQNLAKRLIDLQSSHRRTEHAEDVRFTEGAPRGAGQDAAGSAGESHADPGSDLC
jgi:hypothetical protein